MCVWVWIEKIDGSSNKRAGKGNRCREANGKGKKERKDMEKEGKEKMMTQCTIVLSSTDAEYMALSEMAKDTFCTIQTLSNLQFDTNLLIMKCTTGNMPLLHNNNYNIQIEALNPHSRQLPGISEETFNVKSEFYLTKYKTSAVTSAKT